MKKKKYAIIDIETTGGMPRRDKITEIAIVIFDGEKIVDKYESLVNPERSIPPNITRITGITDDMVKDAPKFYEIAKTVVEKTEDTIFVAHNVRFDYSFIKEAFASLGYTFSKRQLCTVKLSRKAFPGLKSYSLGNLIRHFNIEVENRHRALDDAWATTIILEKILSDQDNIDHAKDLINYGIKSSKLPKSLSIEKIHSLPEATGVYYFLNEYHQIVYVGKSINIRKRVGQHFAKMTEKSARLYKMVFDIHYEITGSELVAMLLESAEIKKHSPLINKAQRNKDYPYFVYSYTDSSGYICFDYSRTSKKALKEKSPLKYYSKVISAKSDLSFIVANCQLCPKLCGLETNDGPCFKYKINECFGACQDLEHSLNYNTRAKVALEYLSGPDKSSFFIIDDGREKHEKAVIYVEDGSYRGYGYISEEDSAMGVEELQECIKFVASNPETDRIVHSFVASSKHLQIIKV